MGVKECSRLNCSEIMCDTYIREIGYICDSCKKEFKEYLKEKGLDIENIKQCVIEKNLIEFMESIPKDYYKNTSVSEYFNEN